MPGTEAPTVLWTRTPKPLNPKHKGFFFVFFFGGGVI